MSTPPCPAETARTEDHAFTAVLERELAEFLATRCSRVAEISGDAEALVRAVERLTRGGKRLRARLCYWGWRGAGGAELAPAAVRAAAALELFQSAALIHDDILDRSDTRRGQPSVHREFERLHREQRWNTDPAHFGASAGILTGDLSLSFSEELYAHAEALVPEGPRRTARELFDTMRTQVMVGQYLDVHAEVAPPAEDPDEQLRRAMTVLRYKSAKYSVEHPVTIGAALAGACEDTVARYAAFALPVGEAFQLRDDVLGVFGDPATTGKPAGDDIREGKRTALVALSARGADPERVRWLESLLGREDLTEDELRGARELMESSGALGRTEELIRELVATADRELASLPTPEVAREGLRALADAAVRRTR